MLEDPDLLMTGLLTGQAQTISSADRDDHTNEMPEAIVASLRDDATPCVQDGWFFGQSGIRDVDSLSICW